MPHRAFQVLQAGGTGQDLRREFGVPPYVGATPAEGRKKSLLRIDEHMYEYNVESVCACVCGGRGRKVIWRRQIRRILKKTGE